LQFSEALFSGDDKIPSTLQYQVLTAARIESLNFGLAIKAMIMVENAVALTDRMQYSKAKEFLEEAIRTLERPAPLSA
jgi:hypothetical protein